MKNQSRITSDQERPRRRPVIKASLGFVFGAMLGLILGNMVGNLALGLIFGAGIGLIIGAGMDNWSNGKSNRIDK